jgi:hypothetical protein
MPGLLSLKGIVLAGLMQAQKLIRAAGDEGDIDPRFRIMTPKGDYLLSMPIADDPDEHLHQMQLLSKFMGSKAALVFTVAGQLADPGAVYCFGATRESQAAAIAMIERAPIRFSSVDWLASEEIADEILTLLPRGEVLLDAAGIAELDAYFGEHGKFPAVRLGGGAA